MNENENKNIDLPEDVIEVLTELITDGDYADRLIFDGIKLSTEKRGSALRSIINNIIEHKNTSDLNGILTKQGFSLLESTIIKNNIEKNLLEEGEGVSNNENDSSLNHVDILSEIENPTPSLPATEPAVAATVSTSTATEQKENQEPTGSTPQVTTLENITSHKPSLSEAIGNIPTIGGFKPIENPTHPAAPLAEKLDQKLSTSTASAPKEVYHVKTLDPYHEPVE